MKVHIKVYPIRNNEVENNHIKKWYHWNSSHTHTNTYIFIYTRYIIYIHVPASMYMHVSNNYIINVML